MDGQQIIPIDTLSPDAGPSSATSIRAVVALLWPYSSATRNSSLLLADSDFRLRRAKGQVRVYLQGAAAQAVAQSQIGIGDVIVLGLDGAHWQEDKSNEEPNSTPGKNVEWELVYRRRIVCRIERNGKEWRQVNVDQRGASPERSSQHYSLSTPTSSLADLVARSTPRTLWKHGRLSGDSLTLSPYDPFADDGVRTRKRLRRSWNDVQSWKLSDRQSSPTKDPVASDDEDKSSEAAAGNETPERREQIQNTRVAKEHTRPDTSGPEWSPYSAGVSSADAFHVSGSTDINEQILPEPGATIASVGVPSRQTLPRKQAQITHQLPVNDSDTEPDDDETVARQNALLLNAESRRLLVFHDPPTKTRKLNPIYAPRARDALIPAAHATTGASHDKTLTSAQKNESNRRPTSFGSSSDLGTDGTQVRSAKLTSGLNTAPELHDDGPTRRPEHRLRSLQDEPIVLSDSSDDDGSPPHGTGEVSNIIRADVTAINAFSSSPIAPSIMLPPPKPPMLLLPTPNEAPDIVEGHARSTPKTPELRGVSSPSLPLPSPFPTTAESKAASFFDSRPYPLPDMSHGPKPKTIKATMTEEKQNLPVPKPRDSKARTSSSSSYRRESGPFSDHIRAAQPFEFDGAHGEVEEAVMDSPEITPIRRVIPGLQSLDSLGEARTGTEEDVSLVPEDILAPVSDGAGFISSSHDALLADEGLHNNARTWADDAYNAPSLEFEHQVIDLDESNAPEATISTVLAELSPPSLSTSVVSFDPNSFLTYDTQMSLGDGSAGFVGTREEHHAVRGSEDDESTLTPQGNQQSYSTSGITRSPGPLNLPYAVSQPLPATDQHVSGASYNLDVQSTLNVGQQTTAFENGAAASDIHDPQLSDSPASHMPNTYRTPQPIPPPTAPSLPKEQDDEVAPPDFERQSMSSQELGLDGHTDGPPPPRSLRQTTVPTPERRHSTKSGAPLRSSRFSDAVSPWFAPRRESMQDASGPDELVHDAQEHQPGKNEKSDARDSAFEAASNIVHSSSTSSDVSLIARAKARLFDISKSISRTPGFDVTSSNDTPQLTPVNVPPKGFRTSISYFTPLHPSHLRPLLNSPSQQRSTVDIMAVVSSEPSTPKRTSKGPRDWNKILSIVTPDSLSASHEWTSGEVRVSCFMRGSTARALLPNADPGDVILLRDFSIISHQGEVELTNKGQEGGWCVFRWRPSLPLSQGATAESDSSNDETEMSSLPQEECRGAPVELGDEERAHAGRLKLWWKDLIADEHP